MDKHNPGKYNFYLKGGPRSVLLIHGITGTPSEMHYLGKALQKAGYTVMCNTLPRHCDTLDELKKVTWQEIADKCRADLLRLKEQSSHVFVVGLSMGAMMSIHLAHICPLAVTAIGALAPTVFYDGWALHKGKFLMDLVWHIPYIRNKIDIREGWPYGLKDEGLRANIERFYKGANAGKFDNKVLLFGSPFFPMACLYQHHLFTKTVKKEMPLMKTPVLILHAREDDMTSLKNAHYVLNHIGSADKSLIVLEDCYHIITIDKEKDKVAAELINFFGKF